MRFTKPTLSRFPDPPKPPKPGPEGVKRSEMWHTDKWVGVVLGVRPGGTVAMIWVQAAYWRRVQVWEADGKKGKEPRKGNESKCQHATWPPTDPDTNAATRGPPQT